MSLERLVDEVRRRSEAELAAEQARFAEAVQKIVAQRDQEVAAIAQESERSTAAEAGRLRAAESARAKVEGRKLVFESRQRAAERSLADARHRLSEYSDSPEYAALVKRLYEYAVERLGKPVRIRGRSEDAALLRSIAGKTGVADPVPISGGIVAETGDGARRLDLSFEELLRRREDDLLELARGAGASG